MSTLINLAYPTRPQVNTTASRRAVDWTLLTNDNLKFAYDLLALHHSPFEVDAGNEIERRITKGIWLELDNPPPPLHNMPVWLVKWLPRAVWKQKT